MHPVRLRSVDGILAEQSLWQRIASLQKPHHPDLDADLDQGVTDMKF